jgi:hypothetical protein
VGEAEAGGKVPVLGPGAQEEVLGERFSVEVCGLAEDGGLGSTVYVATTPATFSP